MQHTVVVLCIVALIGLVLYWLMMTRGVFDRPGQDESANPVGVHNPIGACGARSLCSGHA
jgi:hypothetical protein